MRRRGNRRPNSECEDVADRTTHRQAADQGQHHAAERRAKGRETYGQGGGKHLTVRFTDRKVAFDILKNPRLGVGEAYMDGRLIIEDGTILDLLEMVVGFQPLGGRGAKPRRSATASSSGCCASCKRNDLTRSRRNVAHHYDLSDELYELFLDEDKQYSCAYFTDPANSLEQAQADKKAHIAAKLALEPGQRVLDIGCGWGGMALYLHKVAGVDVLGITLSEQQLKIARQRAAAAGVSDHVKFELIDYRLVEGQLRPDRLGRHVRACRAHALRRVLRQVPRAAEAATA